MGTGSEWPVTRTKAVLRGSDVFSFSSLVLREAKAEERGVCGGGVVTSSSGIVLGTGSGSAGAERPFPNHQHCSARGGGERKTYILAKRRDP